MHAKTLVIGFVLPLAGIVACGDRNNPATMGPSTSTALDGSAAGAGGTGTTGDSGTDGDASVPIANNAGTGGQSSTDTSWLASGGCRPVQGLTVLSQSSVLSGNSGIFADGQYVYISGGSSLYRIPTSGGPAETLYSGPANVGEFYAASGTVAWSVFTWDGSSPYGVNVANAAGGQSVTLPDGVLPLQSPYSPVLVDDDGNVYFEVNLSTGSVSHVWRWSPISKSAAEMPGVGMPDTGADTHIFAINRGQIFWSSSINGTAVGIYVTDIATGTSRQLTTGGIGQPVGLDAKNLYGVGSICPMGACPFTVFGLTRDGSGTLFVAYETADAYWTASEPQADDSGIYWMDWSVPGIYHAAIAPSAPAELVVQIATEPGGSVPANFAIDRCNLYWVVGDAQSTRSLMAIAK